MSGCVPIRNHRIISKLIEHMVNIRRAALASAEVHLVMSCVRGVSGLVFDLMLDLLVVHVVAIINSARILGDVQVVDGGEGLSGATSTAGLRMRSCAPK
jgi:hypothetical protein